MIKNLKSTKVNLILILLWFSLAAIGQSEYPNYTTLLDNVLVKRSNFNELYHNSDSSGKRLIIIEAREYLFNTIYSNVFPYWYGTKWDFNGTTRTPKQGYIACGYFVTNVLADVGFNIPRIGWAQSASEVFIRKLAPNRLKRFSNRPISEVERYLKTTGNGLYLVGLDSHVGFIVVNNDKIEFIHSNYYQANIGVMSEEIDSWNPLNDSSYRIVGKLLSDEMVINWLDNIAYE